ncbi:transposase [Streptomyces lateritius]|nr:transposase [Streptomyces lateritius]
MRGFLAARVWASLEGPRAGCAPGAGVGGAGGADGGAGPVRGGLEGAGLAGAGGEPEDGDAAGDGAASGVGERFILDALHSLDGGPKPETVITDTAPYSDIMFGLFAICDYQFSPADRRHRRRPPVAHPRQRRLRAPPGRLPAHGPPGPRPRALGRHAAGGRLAGNR